MLTFIYLSLLYVCSIQAEFNDHIDFQKVSEITFRNEKYNVLKPTIHEVKDHFKDFIQKRNNNLLSHKIFLDKNGFRHFWRGMEIPNAKSLRRNESKTTVANTNRTTKRDKPRRKKRIEEEYVPIKPKLRDGSLSVRTTFYCPFFGVVRMTTRVENTEDLQEFM